MKAAFLVRCFVEKAILRMLGEYVLALKGTAGGKDLIITDGADIVNDGLAHHQIVDMYNFCQQIIGEKDQSY